MKKMLDYNIPKKINIPKAFWDALAGEITSVFSLGVWVVKDGDCEADYIGGTTGLYFAIKMACWKLGLKDLFEYYDTLEWYDSDQFDEIAVEQAKRSAHREYENTPNEYYHYLYRKKDWWDKDA